MKLQARAFHPRSRAGFVALLAVLVSGAGGGCEVAVPEHKVSPGIEPPPEIGVTQNQVRLRMRSLVDPMCGRIAQSADEIIAGTADRDVRLAALKWKIDAVPALREALFEPDPYTAALDTLALCMQMTDYFETGAGKGELGPASAGAVGACRGLTEEFTQVLASATTAGDASRVVAKAREWASAHPIHHSIGDRESVLAKVFDRDIAAARSTGEAVATVTTTLDDLNRKLEVYSDQLFRQARWEVERLRLEMRSDEVVPMAERAVKSADQAAKSAEVGAAALDRLATAAERTAKMADGIQGLVASERAAAMSTLREDLERAKQFLREERLAAMAQLGGERIAAMAELREAITQERRHVEGEAGKIAASNIDHAIDRITRLVGISLAAVAVLGVVGLFLARWILFSRRA